MSAALAIGVGCRKGTSPEAIVALVSRAWNNAGGSDGETARLFTIADKRDEPGLSAAAGLLGLELSFLSRAVLAAAMDGVVTRSAAAERRFGIASVAEAAALAGAGAGARLVVPRMAQDGVTCAVARDAGGSS